MKTYEHILKQMTMLAKEAKKLDIPYSKEEQARDSLHIHTWCYQARHVLITAFGDDHFYAERFKSRYGRRNYDDGIMQECVAIFFAGYVDYENKFIPDKPE